MLLRRCRTRMPSDGAVYELESAEPLPATAALSWGLGCYSFDAARARARSRRPTTRRSSRASSCPRRRTIYPPSLKGTYLCRDLINTPAGRLGPAELGAAARAVWKSTSELGASSTPSSRRGHGTTSRRWRIIARIESRCSYGRQPRDDGRGAPDASGDFHTVARDLAEPRARPFVRSRATRSSGPRPADPGAVGRRRDAKQQPR